MADTIINGQKMTPQKAETGQPAGNIFADQKVTAEKTASFCDFEKPMFAEKFGLPPSSLNNGTARFNVAETKGGVLSPTLNNNREEILRALGEIRDETVKRFHKENPEKGSPAHLFFENAFESLSVLERSMTQGKEPYLAEVNNPDDPASFSGLADSVFSLEKPDRIYLRVTHLPQQGFNDSKTLKKLLLTFQKNKTEGEKSRYPEDRSFWQNLNPAVEARRSLKDDREKYHEEIKKVVYKMLHETTHYVWVKKSGGDRFGQSQDINCFATELMAFGVMAVVGFVSDENFQPTSVAFGPDQKFYQTILHEKNIRAVGRAFIDQFSRRKVPHDDFETVIVGLPPFYRYMTRELADILPRDLSYTVF